MTLRQLPSVDVLLASAIDLIGEYGRPLTLDAVRAALDSARAAIRDGAPTPDSSQLLAAARADLDSRTALTLRPVINATGVILHTNLGRSLLSGEAVAALISVSQHYSTLEYDLAKGARGSRSVHSETLLTQVTGAEAALVVNNAASALLLALSAMAKGKEVVVSRGQLVEIGGGFRVPDVMKQSGAKLAEVGTTNRTHVHDLVEAITPKTAGLLRAHHSNFKIIGFTTEPTLEEMVAVAREHNLPVIDDLGSGALLDTAPYGLTHEPMVQESVKAGASLVVFSGDKLLGGPQAGIIVGQRALVEKLKKHPLARAVRADKLTLAPLSATLLHYLKDEAARKVPVWRMISMPLNEIEARARRWAAAWDGTVIDGQSTVGGGSLPGETLPTKLAALSVPSPNKFLARLRDPSDFGNPKGLAATPIIARVEGDLVVFDPRTVSQEEETDLLATVSQTFKQK
ncbi:MAG TPA: L-seryl-tRNA(Sec) selenium transferase [Anaerolineales bacterium]|nr:L-seryl-tRNA(Sec) selenium transferase [Anaerolineales bacterium]